MKVLVTGGRNYRDIKRLFAVLDATHAQTPITLIIEGGAVKIDLDKSRHGADAYARQWAEARGIAFKEYKANWQQYGGAAGPMRNQQMLDEGHPDLVIAFPGGKGTASMVERTKRAGVAIEVIQPLPVSVKR